MLFIDFSSAFNTVIPSKLISKLIDLGISPSLCNWTLDFLTNRPQSVRISNHTSSVLTLNTGVPQGCVLSPILHSLFTHDCIPVHGSNKFADDTTAIGLISGNDETAYRDEVQHLATWCANNNLALNSQKTKELIVDHRRTKKDPTHTPIYIDGAEVECVANFKFLGVHLSEDLSWTLNTSILIKKARQRLYFLRKLREAHLSSHILLNCITVWYGNCTVSDQKALQRVVKTAQYTTGVGLPSIKDIYHKRCLRRVRSIIQDSSHPNHRLFTPLPSGSQLTRA